MKGGISAEARDALRSLLRASVSWKEDAPFARQSYKGVVHHCEYCEIEYPIAIAVANVKIRWSDAGSFVALPASFLRGIIMAS